jgi:hypothetical protein
VVSCSGLPLATMACHYMDVHPFSKTQRFVENRPEFSDIKNHILKKCIKKAFSYEKWRMKKGFIPSIGVISAGERGGGANILQLTGHLTD